MLDVHNLDEGKDFKDLPETYVIFITGTDVLKGGLPIYHVDRSIKETCKDFPDGAHIIYVNSQIQDQTELGKLMHDLYCTSANDMYFEELAERVRYYKETKEGLDKMFSVEDELREEGREEMRQTMLADRVTSIKNLMKNLKLSAQQAMTAMECSPEEQKKLMTML